ncbi:MULTISPECIES: hypothetical protein [unclassified Brevundimonas]|uniref:hypothetical protein n=1 Tax=unclassified Brevundimonas TaxID=2622653 RepID=UPI000AF80888|nr:MULTISPECIES: hypothetical protein [unclassified Brevundimonas]
MLRSVMMGAMLSLALAGAAAAEPFRSFADLCLSTDASARVAGGAAKGSGWRDVTTQMAAEMGDMGEEFQDIAVYFNFDPASAGRLSPDQSIEILVTGWGDGEAVMDTKGVVLDLCGVLSPEADALTMSKRVSDHLGVPSSTNDDETLWLYSRQGDRFVSEAALVDAEDDIFMEAARERSLYAVYVFEEDGMAGLFVGAVRPEAKAQDR